MPKFDDKGKSKPNYHAGNKSRSDQESGEGLETATNGTAPGTRYQTSQQIPEVSKAESVDMPQSSLVKRKVKNPGSQIKQDVAARVAVADSDYAGPLSDATNPRTAGLRSLSYSGDAGTILGSAANTPIVAGSDRNPNGGRFEKKLDAANKHINYLASEQVIEEYTNPQPLGESGNERQGYYGTPKNTSARSQKTCGAHPGDPLYQRSADELTDDQVLFIDGQYVKQSNITYDDAPTKKTVFENGIRVEKPYAGVKVGNFMPKSLEVDIVRDSNGRLYIGRFKVNTSDYTSVEDRATVNAASSNYAISINKAEIARQMMDEKAGIETLPNWSPIPRGILQPSQTTALLRRIELEVGSEVATCYRFGKKAFAYQLNKAAKDGMHTSRPMREMILGTIAQNLTSKDYGSGGQYGNSLWVDYGNADVRTSMQKGSPAIMMLLNASPTRYNNKADVLTSPTGLRQFFQIADNNMNVFRLNPTFGAALQSVDVFSTIDREYDPLSPVCLTDRLGLIYPTDPDAYCSYTKAAYDAARVYSTTDGGPLTYAYANRSSTYEVHVKHPLFEGLSAWIEDNINKLWSILTNRSTSETKATWSIPILHSTKSFALWDFLVMAAVPYIQRVRINSMRDILDFEEKTGPYPFTDLISIKDYNPMNAVNYSIKDIDNPLTSKRMVPSTAVRWIMPEFQWGVREQTEGSNAPMYVQPFYFTEGQVVPGSLGTKGSNGFCMADFSGEMNFPIIRSGVRSAYLDDIYAMSERDFRLCLDRMVRPAIGATGEGDYAVYKYSQMSDGIPVISGSVTIKQFMSTPRELGWFMRAPAYLLRAKDNVLSSDFTTKSDKLGVALFATDDEPIAGNTSFRCYCYHGEKDYDQTILSSSTVLVDRAQAFTQRWDCNPAVFMAKTEDSTYKTRPDVGFYLSAKQLGTWNGTNLTLLSGKGYFVPFTFGRVDDRNQYGVQKPITNSDYRVISMAKAFWGRIQKLPMAISPWDTCDFDESTGGGAAFDPYDLCYMFGMAGTMSSDYNQDIYDRLQQVQAQGFLYTKDPFVSDSPVFRDASAYSMK